MRLRTLVILPIKAYQLLVSPVLAPSCRFYPSCSEYACQAIHIHGIVRGLVLSCWRIVRCNPWSTGGFDPVPPALSTLSSFEEPFHHHGK